MQNESIQCALGIRNNPGNISLSHFIIHAILRQSMTVKQMGSIY